MAHDDRSSPLFRHAQKLQALLEIGRRLGARRDVDELLAVIVRAAGELTDADRCSLFLVDKDSGELFSKIAPGLKEGEIRVPVGKGIVGLCAQSRSVVNIAKPYEDERFNRGVDKATGYTTKSILAVPMLDA